MPKSERHYKLNQANEERCTYSFCKIVLALRNSLFKHLKTCKDAKRGSLRRPRHLAARISDNDDYKSIVSIDRAYFTIDNGLLA